VWDDEEGVVVGGLKGDGSLSSAGGRNNIGGIPDLNTLMVVMYQSFCSENQG
jgi:hypothetical protein